MLRRSWRIEGQGEPASVGTVRVAAPRRRGGGRGGRRERRAASTNFATCFLTGREPIPRGAAPQPFGRATQIPLFAGVPARGWGPENLAKGAGIDLRPDSKGQSLKPAQTGQIDIRFSQAEARPTAWEDVEAALEQAQIYWITTVRADGRPHVTPLLGVLHDGAMHFSTGEREQKFRNLEGNSRVALTTGRNQWAGLDVVVEGSVERITGRRHLQALADAVEAKDGAMARRRPRRRGLRGPSRRRGRVPDRGGKVIAFAKDRSRRTTVRANG